MGISKGNKGELARGIGVIWDFCLALGVKCNRSCNITRPHLEFECILDTGVKCHRSLNDWGVTSWILGATFESQCPWLNWGQRFELDSCLWFLFGYLWEELHRILSIIFSMFSFVCFLLYGFIYIYIYVFCYTISPMWFMIYDLWSMIFAM